MATPGCTCLLPSFFATVGPLFQGSPAGKQEVPAAETLLVAIYCLCLLAAAILQRSQLDPAGRLVLSVTLWSWLFPLIPGGGVRLYRSEALLVPSVMLARRLPRLLQAVFLLVMVALAYAESVLFFREALI
jgi:hypothetical protein